MRGPWADRAAAGRELAAALADEVPPSADLLVLGLPRGGVVVAAEVATALSAELDVLVVRKAGVPWHRELALGAITADGARVRNDDVIRRAGLREAEVEAAFDEARDEALRRQHLLRGDRPPPRLAGRHVILVDDGIATGATARAAAQLLRGHRPAPQHVTLAAPVAPRSAVEELSADVDDVLVLRCPRSFMAVGEWYATFGQIEDDEVRRLLGRGQGP